MSRLTQFSFYTNLSAAKRESIKTLHVFKRCRTTVVIRCFGTLAKKSLNVLLLLSPPSLLLFVREKAKQCRYYYCFYNYYCCRSAATTTIKGRKKFKTCFLTRQLPFYTYILTLERQIRNCHFQG